MRFRREDVAKLSGLILKNLQSHSFMTFKAPVAQLQACVEGVILKDLDNEAKIEEEVKKIMEQYRSQIASGAVDPQKIYMMIKKQVAKERKFIL